MKTKDWLLEKVLEANGEANSLRCVLSDAQQELHEARARITSMLSASITPLESEEIAMLKQRIADLVVHKHVRVRCKNHNGDMVALEVLSITSANGETQIMVQA